MLLLTRAPDLFAGTARALPLLPTCVAVVIVASVAALLPASQLMGLAFPIGLRTRIAGGDLVARTGARIGLFYALNVFGAIVGSTAAGFVPLPSLGSRGSLAFVSGIVLLSDLMLLFAVPSRWLACSIGGVGTTLFLVVTATMPDPFADAVTRRYGGEQLIWQEEGIQTPITVNRRSDRALSLYLDGLYQASDTPSQLQSHRTTGHQPMVP